ncbi:MAG: helix-turn-helix domain-containing protein [Ignisphaera sp.]
MRKIVIDNSIGVAEFTVSRPKNSFFSKLSELASVKILLETIYLPGISRYLVIAYSYNRDIGRYIPLLIRDSKYLVKGKIRKIKYFECGGLFIIVAVKSQCEFLKITENSNVSVLYPYIIDKGFRTFTVFGEKKDLDLYTDEIIRYYGEENVEYRSINSIEKLVHTLMKKSLLNLVTEKLTDMELNVIMLAYRNGYFNYPKGSSQEAIGTLLGLSKITVNIHMRKALKKIVEEVVKASS